MSKGIDPIVVQETLQRMSKHPLFINSSVYSRLLAYLVEKALKNEEVKEFTIGADLFQKNYNYDKNDGTVRSHMYNLRKKLAEYYQKEGASELLIFTINKGQYNLDFIWRETVTKQQLSRERVIRVPISYIRWGVLVTLMLLVVFWGVKQYWNQPPPFWEAFFKSNQKNVVVISDQYVVHEKLADGDWHTVLYGDINNNEDLIDYTAKTARDLKITDYTLMSKMAPYCVKNMTEWFLEHQQTFDLKLESNLNYEDIRDVNLIFIGQFKTMNISKNFFLKDSHDFRLYHDGFQHTKNGIKKIYDTQFNQSIRIEYAMVSYTSLSPGKSAFYFVSNNDIGVMATLSKFTNKEWLKNFQKQLNNQEGHFNALFEVSGLQRTEVSCKLVALEEVK